MLLNREKGAALVVMILVASSLSIGVLARGNGISGYSQGCGACHDRPVPTTVTVDVVGIPPTYTPSQTYTVTITANGGPLGTSGGFDMAVTAGTLAAAPGETNVQIDAGEAIHISENGRSWRVDWTAPAPGTGDVIINIAALCGNGGNGANNDDWEAVQFVSAEAAGANMPPSITISSPAGASDWTGGSPHDIAFTASDVEDPAGSLLVWLNYSVTGGAPWTIIAGAQGIAGDSSPFTWTLPFEDSATAAINATAKDTGLLEGYDEAMIPVIDSTPPTVLSTLPLDLEPSAPIGTTVEATFDENMNLASVESAFELRDTAAWMLVPGTFAWVLDTIVFTPSAPLSPGTDYQTNITTTARDDSDPGNTIASQYEWTFTTEIVNTPPSIAISTPSGGESWSGGSVHDITFTASDFEDAQASLFVWLNYSTTGGAPWTPIAGAQSIAGDASPFGWTLPLVDSSTVAVNATVADTGSLSSWATSGLFEIDSTPPSVASTTPLDLEVNVPVTTTIEASFDESMNTASVETAFELKDTVTWTLVPGAFSWVLDTIVFTPSGSLASGVQYQVNITTAAMDDSDPGNPIASQYEWTFTTEILNTPPSIVISVPGGGESWSGGTLHDITFAASDGEDAMASLLVWLNYSITGGAPWTPIPGAQSIAGDTSPFGWTVPLMDSATVVVNASVVDTGGLSAWTASGMFEIDSISPSVLSTSPLDGASGVPLGANVITTWSEPMNTDQTNGSFTLSDNLTWTPQVGAISWAGDTFVFNPDLNLNTNEWYTANFTNMAVDDSDPGNALLTTYSWSFQTAGFVDNNPPSILNVLVDPTPQEVFFAVNISANVTDDIEVAVVSIQITDPLAGSSTTPMVYDTASLRYYLEQPYSIVGTYDFNITATDTSNNMNWSIGQFVIQDTTPPGIVHVPIATEFEGIPIDITGTVTDNYALEPVDPVWLDYTDVLGSIFNITMTPVGGDDYALQIPAQPSPGTVSYFIWAIDGEGNVAMTPTFAITILAVDSEPPEILNVQATPSPQEVFNTVNISATITDPSGVDTATVEIIWPDLSVTNQTLVPALGDVYYLEQPYDLVGTYPYTVWTSDTNGFWNKSSGSFVIQDSAPPLITHTPVTSELTGIAIDIPATVTDNYQLTEVRIDYIDVSMNAFNVSMNWVAGNSYTYQIPAQATPGTVTYLIWAVDSSGNAALTAQYDIAISSPPDNEPPVADAGPDQLNNSEGTAIQFNGTGSTDNVGIVSYRWSFAYGPNVMTLEGAIPVFTFTDVGDYTVTLNVTDAADLYDTDTMVVSVLDTTPPEILAVSPTDGATDISTRTDYVIVFSEAMDTTETVQAISIQDVTIERFQWSSGDTRLVLILSGMAEDKEYTVAISGAADVAGNPLPTESFTFTTVEAPSQPPSISLEQDWWWIVLIIILIVIILMLVLRKAGPEAREPVLYEPFEPEPPMEPEDETQVVTEDSPEDPDVPPEEAEGE
jgi:hypothetical protein